jgi:hypothetical protein
MKITFPFIEKEVLEFYVSTYRREGLPPFEISKPFDLLPNIPPKIDFNVELTWRDPWPFGPRAGVYFVYAENGELIYIGKANVLGNRFYTYFGAGSECVYKESWGTPPRYIRAVAVPIDMPFEALALEAYLISKLKPKHNTLGIS